MMPNRGTENITSLSKWQHYMNILSNLWDAIDPTFRVVAILSPLLVPDLYGYGCLVCGSTYLV
eukprot:9104247-Ditylum_brightwellii.AAC.1